MMMENGPTGGDPSNVKQGDVILAGLDPVALDTWAYEHSLERSPENYPEYLFQAVEKGSGVMNWKDRTKEIIG